MASYNGELFIEKQILSILDQLNEDDELIIVDDNSTDLTINIIDSFHDRRIRLFINDYNKGHVKTFETAICFAKGDFIFLSDQDDYWLPNRINICVNKLQNSNSLMLISNMIETRTQGIYNTTKTFKMPKSSFCFNILNLFFSKSLYFGSLMCFKKELKTNILPFPKIVNAHDIHIALICNSLSTILHHDEILLLRTNTSENLTYKKKSIIKKIKNRIMLLVNIFYSIKYFKFG